tara:strand:+ start:234 stop:851 length:618 start_codon:yes stop_codon:yes gene_type:complete
MNKNIDEINKEIRENDNPPTREEAKQHFVDMTNLLNLKHTFDFDEAYDIGLEIRRRKEFREKISDLEQSVIETSDTTREVIHKANPVKHTFAGGCYIREIYNPANELIITKIHKKEHPFFLMKGEMSILTENGIEHIKAPYQGVTKVGTKRAIYTHEECIFITVHATDNTTVENVEDEVVCTKYEDLPHGSDALEILKEINLKQE